MHSSGKHDKPSPDSVAVLETILEHVADEEAEFGESTAADDRWARNLRQQTAVHIAALRRQLIPARPVVKRAAPVPDRILSLDREELLAQLELLRQSPAVRFAHQDLTGLTTDDLRLMVAAILEPPTEE
jgi:hypothetical protein